MIQNVIMQHVLLGLSKAIARGDMPSPNELEDLVKFFTEINNLCIAQHQHIERTNGAILIAVQTLTVMMQVIDHLQSECSEMGIEIDLSEFSKHIPEMPDVPGNTQAEIIAHRAMQDIMNKVKK